MFLKFLLIAVGLKLVLAFKNDEHCGVVEPNFDNDKVESNTFPWSVAIFQAINSTNPKLICSGTLISSTKVITAAHCIHNKYSEIGPISDLIFKFGIQNVTEEPGTEAVQPFNITIHPDWDVNSTSYDADIAVIEFETEITISKFIRPICMWDHEEEAPEFKEGVVATSGLKSSADILKTLTLPVLTNRQCFAEKPVLEALSSRRTFCAGVKNGAAPCLDDSGSGLFFEYKGRSYLGGLVSATVLINSFDCNTNSYAIFTDVVQFMPWITDNKVTEGKCYGNSDCDANKACSRNKCIDPCERTCGEGADCKVINHNPICVCGKGKTGDPFIRCLTYDLPIETHACKPNPCGSYSACRDIFGIADCECLHGYSGSPPTCHPECVMNSDCPTAMSCINLKCKDPCLDDTCGNNAKCTVEKHNPICSCPEDHTGNPFMQCSKIEIV